MKTTLAALCFAALLEVASGVKPSSKGQARREQALGRFAQTSNGNVYQHGPAASTASRQGDITPSAQQWLPIKQAKVHASDPPGLRGPVQVGTGPASPSATFAGAPAFARPPLPQQIARGDTQSLSAPASLKALRDENEKFRAQYVHDGVWNLVTRGLPFIDTEQVAAPDPTFAYVESILLRMVRGETQLSANERRMLWLTFGSTRGVRRETAKIQNEFEDEAVRISRVLDDLVTGRAWSTETRPREEQSDAGSGNRSPANSMDSSTTSTTETKASRKAARRKKRLERQGRDQEVLESGDRLVRRGRTSDPLLKETEIKIEDDADTDASQYDTVNETDLARHKALVDMQYSNEKAKMTPAQAELQEMLQDKYDSMRQSKRDKEKVKDRVVLDFRSSR